jgi:hypothetical protein
MKDWDKIVMSKINVPPLPSKKLEEGCQKKKETDRGS